MLAEQCALMHMFFGKDQCVPLLKHVRLLEKLGKSCSFNFFTGEVHIDNG